MGPRADRHFVLPNLHFAIEDASPLIVSCAAASGAQVLRERVFFTPGFSEPHLPLRISALAIGLLSQEARIC
jgi:hypothetical protein